MNCKYPCIHYRIIDPPSTKDVGTQPEPAPTPQVPEAGVSVPGPGAGGLPLVGAVLGLCVGGPVGILAGAKLGGVAAIGGGILGYTGASIIREQREMRRLLLTSQTGLTGLQQPARSQSLHTVKVKLALFLLSIENESEFQF